MKSGESGKVILDWVWISPT